VAAANYNGGRDSKYYKKLKKAVKKIGCVSNTKKR